MKSRLKFSIVLFVSLILFGCNNGSDNSAASKKAPLSPVEIVNNYLSAQIDAAPYSISSDTYKYLSQSDKNAISLDEYLSNTYDYDPRVLSKLAPFLREKTSFKVVSSNVGTSEASFEVEYTFPSLKPFTELTDPKNLPYLDKALANLKVDTSVKSLKLVKEGSSWGVFLSLANKKKANALADEARKLAPSMEMISLNEGLELLSMKSDLLEANKKYEEALNYHESFLIKNDHANLKKQLDKLEVFEANRELVLVNNTRVAKAIGSRLGVFGEVKNTSNLTFDKVKVIIYFLNESGDPVFEKDFTPVLVSKYSYSDRNEALKPGYSRKFGVKADDAPSDWARKVRVEILDLEVKKES